MMKRRTFIFKDLERFERGLLDTKIYLYPTSSENGKYLYPAYDVQRLETAMMRYGYKYSRMGQTWTWTAPNNANPSYQIKKGEHGYTIQKIRRD